MEKKGGGERKKKKNMEERKREARTCNAMERIYDNVYELKKG